MYTYKRFRTSKSAVTIILIALALLAWGILGPTDTSLARKGGTAFDVRISLKDGSGWKSFHGTGYWAGRLGVNFFKLPPDTPVNPTITVDGVVLKLQAMTVIVKARQILGVILQFEGNDGFSYFTDYDTETSQWQSIPVHYVEGEVSADTTGFTIHLLGASAVPVCRRLKKEGNPVLGTVDVGDPEFTPI